MSTDIRVALVFGQDAGTQALRAALANAGVTVALECQASALDASRLQDMHVDAIVVNLDPDLEELLDEVTEALDSATQPVIYNDPAASSDLSGWDRARWMRHLSAKLKGQSNVTPPPPPGAELIPVPVQRAAPIAAAAAPVADASAAEAAEPAQAQPAGVPAADSLMPAPEGDFASVPADGGAEMPFDLGLGDLDLMFEQAPPAQAMPSAEPAVALTIGEDLGDLDALFAESDMVDLEPAPTPAASGDSAADAPAVVVGGAEFDLDALFVEEPASTPGPATSMATESELTDLDALFREFEASTAEQPASPGASAEVAKSPREAPEDWSLEPLQDLTLDDLETGATSAEPPARDVQPAPAPVVPADLEASLALADLKLFDDEPSTPATAPTPSQATGLADFDSLGFASLDLESGESGAILASPTEPGEELSLADLDFGVVPGSSAAPASGDADIGDLESLFEPVAELAADGLALPDLDRVFVLGASIGGPEAIKAFLAQLPASVPAAFVVAQHMGAEFLEMMAVQLDSASPLPVRFPKAGERLRHGEVVVAPANEQLSVDDSGHLHLGAAASGSPYNPSIDHLVRAMADRFGDRATLILFSGMGTDAIEGGRYLSARGGQVWAQDRSTCVIASMIDSAKSQGLVRFEGTPAQLAERVLQLLS